METRIPVCCDEFTKYIEFYDKFGSIGRGDGLSYVTIRIDLKDGINIDDGWNYLPSLNFTYCPFCGKKQDIFCD